jgi:hypothetical protein
MQTIKQLIDNFISDTLSAIDDFNKFKSLSEKQINWKPSVESWSIAECIDHLLVTNKIYLDEFERQFAQKQIRCNITIERVKNKFLARIIIKSVNPKNIKRVKTFSVFNPSSSFYKLDVIDKYAKLQDDFVNLITKYKDLNLNKYSMSSPAAKIIKENFCDVLEIIRLHDRRHFNQATRIFNHQNFPKE